MKKNKGYIKLERDILELNISSNAKIIYSLIVSRDEWIDTTNKPLELIYTIDDLANKLKISRKSVMKSINDLEYADLLVTIRRNGLPTVYEPQPLKN